MRIALALNPLFVPEGSSSTLRYISMSFFARKANVYVKVILVTIFRVNKTSLSILKIPIREPLVTIPESKISELFGLRSELFGPDKLNMKAVETTIFLNSKLFEKVSPYFLESPWIVLSQSN